MSDGIILYGAKIERSLDGSTAWAEYPEALGIAVPQATRDWVDFTSLDSPGGYREWKPGLKDSGEASFQCNYTPAGFAMAKADEAAGEAGDPIFYRATLKPAPSQSTGDVHEFQAYPTVSMDDATDVGGKVTFTVTLRMTGEPEYTAGTAAT